MNKKYEFTDETKILIDGTVLHRIRSIIQIKTPHTIIKPGTLGGWIENEINLSHAGNAWVCDNAKVCGDAQVYGDAMVFDNARVCGDAKVCGDAQVYGNARVFDNAWVCDNAKVYGNAWVCDNAQVYCDAMVFDNARVCGDADISKTEHYINVGPIGSRNDYTTFYKDKFNNIQVKCGCFTGSIDEFLKKVDETHKDSKHRLIYRSAASLAMLQINLA